MFSLLEQVREAVNTSGALLQVRGHSDMLEGSQHMLTCPNGAGKVPLPPYLQNASSRPVCQVQPRLGTAICEHRADWHSAQGGV